MNHEQPTHEVLEATVVGGGLAGLVASLELVRRGFSVTLFEASDHLGGKAASFPTPTLYDARFERDDTLRLPDGVESDHGYHIFPAWYVNMRALWREIGIDPATDVHLGKTYYDLPPAVAGVRQPVTPEPLPTLRQLLAICDLVLQPDRHVEDLTLQAFLCSRDYHREENPISLNDFTLNALTIGDADISARVIRNVFRQWLPVFTEPNWDALKGSLGEILVGRLHARIEAVAAETGVRFRVAYRHRLVALDPGGTAGLTAYIEDATGCRHRVRHQPVVMAVPPEVVRRLDSHDLFVRDTGIGRLNYLRANPFSALDVHFRRRLPEMTAEHFTLQDSKFGITGYDVSQHWPRLKDRDRTVLQFVVANSRLFAGLDEGAFVRALAEEIGRFIPEVPGEVEFYVPHPNVDAPLFVNDVGTWHYRPDTRCGVANLYFAGDYVKNETEVTSMEGAVRTGLMAAEAIREDFAPDRPAVRILPARDLPPEIRHLADAVFPRDPVLARLKCLTWLLRAFGREADAADLAMG